ncbi:histidine phosphatase family protein [bacterium]|nr:histidine phosphatase family protein [bacterium]
MKSSAVNPERGLALIGELAGRVLLDETTGHIRLARKEPLVSLAATVVAVRHGETHWNAVENSWQGCVNIRKNRLTAHGVEQAERAARQLFRQIKSDLRSKRDIRKRFEGLVIFSSELDRARDTAGIFARYTAAELKKIGVAIRPRVRTDPRLNEISFGFWDNKTLDQIERESPEQAELARHYMRLNALARADKGRRAGESFLDVVLRGLGFLKSLQSHGEDNIILIFSSAVLINALRVGLGDQSLENRDGVLDWRSYSPPHGRQTLLTEGRAGSWFGDLDSAVDRLYNEMNLPLREDLLTKFIDDFIRQMQTAATRPGAPGRSLAMEKGFFSRPVHLAPGRYMGVDVGGTYLRIALAEVTADRRVDESSIVVEEFVIPDILKTGDRYRPAKGDDLFRFISGGIEQILSAGTAADCKIGLTVAFPMALTGPAAGHFTDAIRAIKGWSIPDLAGRDPARLLKDALTLRGLTQLEVAALADDTTGTLLTGEVLGASSYGSAVVGTGMDVAVWEGDTVWDVGAGRFDLAACPEIRTGFDRIVDRNSGNPGARLLEKMVSAKYLPEILRAVLNEFIHHEFLFDGFKSSVLESPYHELDNPQGFRAQDLSAMILDRDQHQSIQRILERVGVRESTLEERIVLRRIARLILERSAQLAALAVAASVRYANPRPDRDYVITLDGNVVGRGAGYQKSMSETLRAALDPPLAEHVHLVYRKSASAIGGCLLASTAGFIVG